MSEASDQVIHPLNPILIKDLNTPKERGAIRFLADGSLLYREPITDTEVPAVRLEEIRPRLVEEASKKKSYRFPKKRGYEDTNVTAFVKKDYNYGPKRENRPDRLHQIRSDGAKGEKPNGYVMDEGRIVLDAFDHGLRNFGHQLPIYISSELEGHDIEDYLRRNREISVYDLVARAPNGYFKGPPESDKRKRSKAGSQAREWHAGPPRVGTFSMRATRFRLRAGLLSWEKKDGTDAKNRRILDLIPAQYQEVNSTKGWRDLNKEEMNKIKAGHLSKPQQGPKAKRRVVAKDSEEDEGLVNNEEDPEQDKDTSNNTLTERDNGEWPENHPEDNAETLTDTRKGPSKMSSLGHQKRTRAALDADSEECSNDRSQKRARVTSAAQFQGSEGGRSRITTSRFGNQQQRQPALKAYTASGTTTTSTHPTAGQSSYPSFSGHQSRSSSRVSYGNNSQLFNPSSTTDAPTRIPRSQYQNAQFGSGFSSLQSPTARYDRNSIPQGHVQQQRPSNGYTQIGVPHLNQGNSHSYRPSYHKHTNDSTPQNVGGAYHSQASGYYNPRPSAYHSQSPYAPAQNPYGANHVPESGYHTNRPSAFTSQSPYASTQVPSQSQISAHPYSQPIQPTYTEEWLNPLQPPISHSTNGKRKRANTGTSEQQQQQQHPTKRAKGHTTTEATIGQVQNPSDFMLGGAEYLTSTPGFKIPTPGHAYGQMPTHAIPHAAHQGTTLPSYSSSSQNPFSPAHADPMNAHEPSFQAQQPTAELETLLLPIKQYTQMNTQTVPHPAHQGSNLPPYSSSQNPFPPAHVDPINAHDPSFQAQQPALELETPFPPTQQHGQTDSQTIPHPAAYQGYTMPSYYNQLTSTHVDPWTGNFSSHQAQPAVDMPDSWGRIYPETEHVHPESNSFF